jgi:5-methylcytosine-specific restriction endonuclease McrA
MSNCPVCKQNFQKLSKHVSSSHPQFRKEQEELVVKYYNQNMTTQQIADLPDVIFEAKNGVIGVLKKYFTKEELESRRVMNIKKTLTKDYASGEYDWIKNMNIERVKSEEGRLKNSNGLKTAYENGDKVSWNKNLNSEIDDRVKAGSIKIKKTMRKKYENGELKNLFKSGPDSILWNPNRDEVSRLYRGNLDFSKKERELLIERAKCKCEQCEVSCETLSEELSIFKSNRLTLECDHITPISLGGTKDWNNNGKVLCTRCHIIKSLKEEFPDDKIRHQEIENRYNLDPATYLYKKFSGIIDAKSNIWSKDLIQSYISPMTKSSASQKFIISEIKNNYPNILIFFFDEWYNKREVCMSMIQNKLKQSATKIHARKTKIVELTHKESKDFFEKNHISGDAKNIYSFGLIVNNEIVSAISFRNSFIEKYKNKIEIARFASKLNTNVVGGFSKLLKHSISFMKERKYDAILTYADLRFGGGNVYGINGFIKLGKTDLDYFYTNGYRREHRFKYRAQPGLSEKDVASAAGVYKIYGCGSNIYEYKL